MPQKKSLQVRNIPRRSFSILSLSLEGELSEVSVISFNVLLSIILQNEDPQVRHRVRISHGRKGDGEVDRHKTGRGRDKTKTVVQ